MEKYQHMSLIGKGNFGSISKIRRVSDGKILVWKELNYGKMDEKEKHHIVSEVNILRELHHPNIVKYHDRIIDKKQAKIYIVMEYCQGGDLSQLIKRCKRNNEYINEDVIYESLSVKRRLVELDPYDQKERMLLNFGHTFGHSIELKMNLKHGEAVSVGMLMAIKFGNDLGLTDISLYEKVKSVLELYELPVLEVDYKEYLKETLYDKKNLAGIINFIFVDKIGNAFIHKVKEGDLV